MKHSIKFCFEREKKYFNITYHNQGKTFYTNVKQIIVFFQFLDSLYKQDYSKLLKASRLSNKIRIMDLG